MVVKKSYLDPNHKKIKLNKRIKIKIIKNGYKLPKNILKARAGLCFGA